MTTPMSRSSRCALSCAAYALACVLLATVGSVHPVHAEPGEGNVPKPWVVECIDCPHTIQYLTPQAAQIDSQGVIHVVYGGDALYHAWQTPAGWQVEVADSLPNTGRYAGLAIDNTDRLHAVYLDENAHMLRYAVREAGGWRIEALGPGNYLDGDPFPAIAVGPGGEPHIAYYYPTDADLYYLVRTVAGWQQELVDGEHNTGRYASLAVDNTGRPHIAYIDDTTTALRYAVKASGAWTLRTVDSQIRATYGAALALDAAGNVHLAQATYSTIVYFAPEGNGWREEVVAEACTAEDPGLTSGFSSCPYNVGLRLDAAGRPHLGYGVFYSFPYSLGQAVLRYAERTTGQWRVHADGLRGTDTQLILPPGGDPQLLGVDRMVLANHARSGSGWQSTVIDDGGAIGGSTSLAVDDRDGVHVSSYNGGGMAYRYYLREAGGWAQSSQPEWATDAKSALALSPARQARVLYLAARRGGPYMNYATASLGGWSPDTSLGEAVGMGDSFDQVIDRNGVTHALLASYGRVVYVTAGNPPQQTVIAVGNGSFEGLSLALDRRGTPHLAYVDQRPGVVYYGTIRASRWITESVTPPRSVPAGGQWYTAIGVGPDDRPQIVYSYTDVVLGDGTPSTAGIVLSRFDGKQWQIAWSVGSYAVADSAVDLAVDSDNRAHIAWYDGESTSLQYTVVPRNSYWDTVRVDSDWDVGRNPSLALDRYGRPHISYLDATRGDLKQAYIPTTITAGLYLPAVRK